MDNKTVEISGSHGTFVIDLRVGNIISKNLLNDEYANITQFNIHEFTNFWTDEKPMDKFPFYGIDIIDIGYWYNDENGELKYEPPESEHRDFIYGIITEEEYFGNQVKQQEPDKKKQLKWKSKNPEKKRTHRLELTVDIELSDKLADRIFNNTQTDWHGKTHPDEPYYSLIDFVISNAFKNNSRTIKKIEIAEH